LGDEGAEKREESCGSTARRGVASGHWGVREITRSIGSHSTEVKQGVFHVKKGDVQRKFEANKT